MNIKLNKKRWPVILIAVTILDTEALGGPIHQSIFLEIFLMMAYFFKEFKSYIVWITKRKGETTNYEGKSKHLSQTD